jgi:hypothetical protein
MRPVAPVCQPDGVGRAAGRAFAVGDFDPANVTRPEAYLDARNDEGSTALITASLFCRKEMVALLLEAGADQGIRNDAGSTALDVVTLPFAAIKPIDDMVGPALEPFGLELDYARIEAARPQIAELLR